MLDYDLYQYVISVCISDIMLRSAKLCCGYILIDFNVGVLNAIMSNRMK